MKFHVFQQKSDIEEQSPEEPAEISALPPAPPSRHYRLFWGCYWGVIAVLIAVLWKPLSEDEFFTRLTGTDLPLHITGIATPLILAGIAAVSAICTECIMRPREGRDASGKLIRRPMRPLQLIPVALLAAYGYWIIDSINNPSMADVKPLYIAANIAGLFIMNLVALLWFNSLKRSMMLMLSVTIGMSIAFWYVYTFRGEPLQLIDFISIRTAAEVAGSYRFTLPSKIAADIILWLTLLGVIIHMREYVLIRSGKRRKILLRVGACAVMIALVPFYYEVPWNGALDIVTDLYRPYDTYTEVGTELGFFCVGKYMRLTPPDGYSASRVTAAAGKSLEEDRGAALQATGVKPVNIIAIMNESWADFTYAAPGMKTNQDVMPFYHSMSENTIKGQTLVCITGGGTAKTEYEFLTGNSMKRNPAMVPYVSYFTQDQYSLVTTLRSQGYRAVAMHPNKGSNWKRDSAYPLLGFEKFYTEEDFPADAEMVHGHISDAANYAKIIDVVESKKSESDPLFLFDVTMQNHGGYTENGVEHTVSVDGYSASYEDEDVVQNYLSMSKTSDDALRDLIGYFSDCGEPTIIVMFGDHYPHVPDSFTRYLTGGKLTEDLPLAEEEKWYATPFFIWTNYDIPEESGVLTSTNYLGTMALEQTGLAMPGYNRYLAAQQKLIPALNHLGYLDADGTFHDWEDAPSRIRKKEFDYESLQYNELAARATRLNWFFSLDGVSR